MVVKKYMKFLQRWREESALILENNKGTNRSTAAFTGALIAIIVGLALLPVVQEFANDSKAQDNSSQDKLIDLIPLFWVLAVLAVAVAMTVAGFKSR